MTSAASLVPEASALREMRVLITHDWLVTWGGAERCLEQMLEVFPQADLVVSMLAPWMRNANAVTRRAAETWLGKLPGARTHHRWFVPLEGAAFASIDTSSYDLVLSSAHSFAKMVRRPRRGLHVCYCYSPPRYLWDLYESHREQARPMERLAMGLGTGVLRRLDLRAAQHVDSFFAISRCVADRIARWYGRQAEVIYPPVEPKPHVEVRTREDFLFTIGRLVPYKRVDLAINAARKLGMRLVIAGDGPERARLECMAGRGVEFVGHIEETEAGRLLSSCAAFVFCAEEDFGISPLEANAHGTPVVGYARGGLTETMIEGMTAEFFKEQTVDALVGALERALVRDWDRDQLKANASRFGAGRFRRELSERLVAACGLVTGT